MTENYIEGIIFNFNKHKGTILIKPNEKYKDLYKNRKLYGFNNDEKGFFFSIRNSNNKLKSKIFENICEGLYVSFEHNTNDLESNLAYNVNIIHNNDNDNFIDYDNKSQYINITNNNGILIKNGKQVINDTDFKLTEKDFPDIFNNSKCNKKIHKSWADQMDNNNLNNEYNFSEYENSSEHSSYEETHEKNNVEHHKDTIKENHEDNIEESMKDTIEETYEDNIEEHQKDTLKENHEDNIEEPMKDTIKETYEDTIKETYEDTIKETYKDNIEEPHEDNQHEILKVNIINKYEYIHSLKYNTNINKTIENYYPNIMKIIYNIEKLKEENNHLKYINENNIYQQLIEEEKFLIEENNQLKRNIK